MGKNNINTWNKEYFSISYEKKSESCSHTKQSTVRGAPNIKNQVREEITCLECGTKRVLMRKSTR
jgi:hypothetical protein